MNRLALAAALLAALPALAKKPPGAEPPSKDAQEQKPMSEADVLSKPPNQPFTVEVKGEGEESFLGKRRCAYWEWVYGDLKDGRLDSYSVAYHSEKKVQLAVDGSVSEVPWQRIRLHAGPTFEKTFTGAEKDAPEILREEAKKRGGKVYAAEYCLESGKRYEAVVREEHFHLPPKGPGAPPARGSSRVLLISEKGFKDGEPQVEATPVFRHWSY